MGLGKTLESLMLVLANPAPEGWAVTDLAKAPPRNTRDVSSNVSLSAFGCIMLFVQQCR